MNIVVQIEHSASSSQSKHEGESSFDLCDRLSRTCDNSQRQLPTDQDYAASTREYQIDQSSLKTAPTAARSVLEKRRNQRQQQTHRLRRVDTVTPYQVNALIEVVRCAIGQHKGVCRYLSPTVIDLTPFVSKHFAKPLAPRLSG
jgi:hypothetical protein